VPGSIRIMPVESEDDVWFTYCACAIKYILEWKFDTVCSLDVEAIKSHILSCETYDRGFSWISFGESHSGLSYCALASLKLIDPTYEPH